jgi:hypothetical protein
MSDTKSVSQLVSLPSKPFIYSLTIPDKLLLSISKG